MIGIFCILLILAILASFFVAVWRADFRHWLLRPLHQWIGRDDPRGPRLQHKLQHKYLQTPW